MRFDEVPDAKDQLLEAGDVRAGGPPVPIEEGESGQGADHLGSVDGRERRDTERDVVQELGGRSSETARDDGAERRVVRDAREHLDPPLDELLHQEPFEGFVGGREPIPHLRGGGRHLGRTGEAESYASHVGLVQRAEGLEDHVSADPGGHAARLLGRVGLLPSRRGDPATGEEAGHIRRRQPSPSSFERVSEERCNLVVIGIVEPRDRALGALPPRPE